MQYLNTKQIGPAVSFRTATLNGLAPGNGLYVPEYIPKMEPDFLDSLSQVTYPEIAFRVMKPFVEESITDEDLQEIVNHTVNFPFPLQTIETDIAVLELFHGPTMAFKDVGARFMAQCLSKFAEPGVKTTVLVATSGDTGSAVAHGFYQVPNVEVVILYPAAKVSPFQAHQMCSLGHNIRAVSVEGTFDDCQAMVKRAFQDEALNKRLNLSSANSINVARLLPQMLYYYFMYSQLQASLGQKPLVVSVPSGNFGNLTAGLYAQRMGLPIHRFVAANNANDTFFKYWQHGQYLAKPSVETYANAMDVGNPSNFERMMHLFGHDHAALRAAMHACSQSDKEILEQMEATYKKSGYILDPHGAVAFLGLKSVLAPGQMGVFLATASPAKFESVVKMVVPEFTTPDLPQQPEPQHHIRNEYQQLLELL